jgi:hypothetical protein
MTLLIYVAQTILLQVNFILNKNYDYRNTEVSEITL